MGGKEWRKEGREYLYHQHHHHPCILVINVLQGIDEVVPAHVVWLWAYPPCPHVSLADLGHSSSEHLLVTMCF